MLWKHVHNVHDGDIDQELEMKILKRYGRDNLTRRVNEAVRTILTIRLCSDEGEPHPKQLAVIFCFVLTISTSIKKSIFRNISHLLLKLNQHVRVLSSVVCTTVGNQCSSYKYCIKRARVLLPTV